MLRRIILAVTALSLLPALAVGAEKSQPTSKPATPEAVIRAVLKSLAKSLQEGKADGIREVVYAADAQERKMVDAMATMAAEIARLRATAAKLFGEDEAKNLTGDVSAEMGRIDEAKISIEGDAATVSYAHLSPTTAPSPAPAPVVDGDDTDVESATTEPSSVPLVLKKIEGRWRVPMSELSKETTPQEIEQRLADLEAQTKVISELCDEIKQGKYKSADKASEAWQLKMMQALTKKPDEKKDSDKNPEPKPQK